MPRTPLCTHCWAASECRRTARRVRCTPPAVDDVEEVVAYVPIATGVQQPDDRAPMALGEVPAATVAVLTHHGGYDSIADTYQLLGRWVAEHAVSADLQVREIYVISPAEGQDPQHYRTDICWPLIGDDIPV